jgi:hypothetical protein
MAGVKTNKIGHEQDWPHLWIKGIDIEVHDAVASIRQLLHY